MADGEGFQIPAGEIVLKTAVDFKQVDRDLDELAKKGEEAGQETSKGFRRGFEEDAKGAAETSRRLTERLEETQKASEETGASFEELSESAETAGDVGTGLAAILGQKLARGARAATGHVVGLVEIGIAKLADGAENLGQQLQRRSREMERFGTVTMATGQALETTGRTVEQVAHGLTLLRIALVTGTVVAMGRAISKANDFEETFNRLETVLPKTDEELQSLRSELSELAAEVGVADETVNETFFKTITRMPRLAEDTEKAMELTRTALEAGATEFTNAAQAVETYEAVLQGFQLEAENAERISDKLFRTQELAGVTFDRIAASIGDVASITDALGGEFEELLSIYATLVPTGQSVSEVTTQIQAVVSGMIDPMQGAREEARQLGVDMSASAIRSRGLLNVIQDIIEATEGDPEVISQLFGRREAVNFLTTIASRMETVRSRQAEITNASGEHQEAVEETNESVDRLSTLIKEEWADSYRQLGFTLKEFLQNPFIGFLEAVHEASRGLTALINAGFRGARAIKDLGGAFTAFAGGDIDRATEKLNAFRRELRRTLLQGAGPLPSGLRDVLREDVLPSVGLGEIEEPASEAERIFRDLREIADETGASLEGVVDTAIDEIGKGEQLAARLESMLADVQDTFEERVGTRPGRTSLAFLDLPDPEDLRGEEPEPIEAPASPIVDAIERIEEARRAGQTRAFAEFLRTGDAEAYERALRDVQRRVNRMTEREFTRLTQVLGFQRDELEQLTGLYDRSVEEVEDFAVALDELPEKPFGDLEGGISTQEGVPRPPGGGRRPPGANVESLRRLREHIAQLNTEQMDQAEIADAVAEKMDELGLEHEDLTGIIRALLQELGLTVNMLGSIGEEGDDAGDSTRNLADEVENLAQLAGGVLQLADAFGVFGDEASDALQRGVSAATQLAQGVGSLKDALAQGASGFALAGPIGAIAGGAAGILGTLGSLVGESAEERRRQREITKNAQELAEALERLRHSAEAVRSVFEETPGADIVAFREALQGLDTEDLFEQTGFIERLTGGELKKIMDDLGLTISDLEDIAASAGIEIEDLLAALRGTFTEDNSIEEAKQQFEALQEALQELELEQALEDFTSRLDLLQQEFELFDIEDPVRQLERMREVLLQMGTDLPPALEQALSGADLSTEEGRRRVEQVIQQLFRQLQAGELTAEDLGGLTLDQFQELLGQLEGTLDEAAREEEGRTGGFEQTRGITEITANRLTGRLTTLDVRAMKRNELLGRILAQLGGDVPTNLGTGAAPAPVSRRGGGGVSIETIAVGPFDFEVDMDRLPDDPEAAGTAFGRGLSDEMARRLDRKLAELRQDRSR